MRHKLINAQRQPAYRKRAVANGYGLDVKCVHDPTGTYPRGGLFTIKNFDYTARLRFWPAGSEFLIGITDAAPRAHHADRRCAGRGYRRDSRVHAELHAEVAQWGRRCCR